MRNTETIQGEKFTEVIRKIEGMTSSQQRFIQEMLSQRKKVPKSSRRKILTKSFGLWAGREDIGSSMDYVDTLRKGWESRLKRIEE